MKHWRMLGFVLAVLLALPLVSQAQTWTALNHQSPVGVGTTLLLRNGKLLVEDVGPSQDGTGDWYLFAPDSTGSYQNGTWTQAATMPSTYAPLYFASQVLPNGFVLVNGGEYNFGSAVWTTLGAYYNTNTNTWAAVTPPSGWSTIGDAQSIILDSGQYMLANCCTMQQAIINYQTRAWTATGTGKADINDEEGWTLLPGGDVLTVDAYVNSGCPANPTNSEIYNASTGTWSSAGSTIVPLGDCSPHYEMGPAVLRPDGTVFATGATGNTSVYNTANGVWTAGPAFPNGLDIADGPASLLPDGNVLAFTSPGVFNPGGVFFEWNGTSLTQEPGTPHSGNASSYSARMTLLPTGQVWFSDGTSNVYLYNANGTYQSAWQPTIIGVSSTTLTPGHTYKLKGTQLNGLGQGAAYGDDAQMNTNYPLIQLKSSSGNVVFAPTHTESTYAIATGSTPIVTEFDVPSGLAAGTYSLTVIANGIPSAPTTVTVN